MKRVYTRKNAGWTVILRVITRFCVPWIFRVHMAHFRVTFLGGVEEVQFHCCDRGNHIHGGRQWNFRWHVDRVIATSRQLSAQSYAVTGLSMDGMGWHI